MAIDALPATLGHFPVVAFQYHDLQGLNTFGIAAKARQLAYISHVGELHHLHATGQLLQPTLVMGGGSNMLFLQEVVPALVLHCQLKGMQVLNDTDDHVWVRWGAGVVWHEAVMQAVANGWGGLENLALIPGTMGAAPVQNIGAYGVELKELLHDVEAFHLETGKTIHLNATDCAFGYRNSVFKHELKGKVMITAVTLKLTKVHAHQLNTSYGAIKEVLIANGIIQPGMADVAQAVISIRQSKLPDPAELGNAGSFFKNPEIPEAQYQELKQAFPAMPGYPTKPGLVKVPAGWLIEQAGLKGYRDGACGVHAKQALVLVNYGGANGQQLVAMAHLVMDTVRTKYQISLEPEVNWI